MKALIATALSSTLLVSACSKAPDKRQQATHPASPSTASPQQPEPAVRNHRWTSGEEISATYPSTEEAVIQYEGRSHVMRIAVSGSGARYVGDGLEWWPKGSGAGAAGTLFRHQADGTAGESVETCVEF